MLPCGNGFIIQAYYPYTCYDDYQNNWTLDLWYCHATQGGMTLGDAIFVINILILFQLKNYWCQEYSENGLLIETHFQFPSN